MSRVVLCVQNMGVPDDPRVWREACSLAAAGHGVTVVAPRTGAAPRRERIDGVDVVRYRNVAASGIVGQLVEVVSGFVGTVRSVAALRRHGVIDVLHVANPPDTLFPLGWWLRRDGTRFVYDQHDVAPELAAAKLGRHVALERLLRALEQASCRAAHLVIASNNSSRRRLIGDGVAPAKITTVRLGPAIVDVAEGTTAGADGGLRGGDGSSGHRRRARRGVRRRRRGNTRPIRLLLIGRGEAVPELRRRITDLGIADTVTWTGWVPRAEVHERLRTATVGVSPDVDDPYTRLCTMIKVSEYLAAGLPAIVADLPENRATAGDAAAYFRAGDVDDLATRLEEVLFDGARRRAMAEAAARRAPALVWDASAVRLLAAYDHLLAGAPAVEGEQHIGETTTAGAR